jgi:hypothetical protein
MIAVGLEGLSEGHATAIDGRPQPSGGHAPGQGDNGEWRRSARLAATDRWP